MPISRHTALGFRQSHAFVIGIDEYRGLNANLKTAVQDAEDIALRLKALQGFDNVLLMNNAGKEQIMQLLKWLAPEEGPQRAAQLTIPNQTFTYGEHSYSSRIGWLQTARKRGEPRVVGERQKVQIGSASSGRPSAREGLGTVQNQPSRRLDESDILNFSWQKPDTKDGVQHFSFGLSQSADLDIQPEDSIVFYYAGHGFPGEIKQGPAGFLSPTDAKNELLTNDSLISMDELYTALSQVNCKHTLLLLDCCFAGKFRFSSMSRGRPQPFLMPMHERRFERYKTSAAWQVLVSAGPDQLANDSAKWADIRENSPFAAILKQALEGGADLRTFGNKTQGDGIITATELFLYVWNEVEEITADVQPQHPGLFPMEQHREGEFIFLNPQMDQEQFKFAQDPDRNPYKGLLPFEPEDANLFFGRDKALASLMRKIPFQEKGETGFKPEAAPHVLFITAPSAAGKSSLIKAGLFPSLQKKYGYEELFVFRPAPVDQIVGQSIKPEEKEHKGNYQRNEWTGIDHLLAALDPSKKQMILVDQFEEFFTEFSKREEQQTFEQQLVHIIENATDRREQPLLLLICMRSDVEWQMAKTRWSGKIAEGDYPYWSPAHIFRLIRMDLDELRQALTGPAWWALYDFKDTKSTDHTDTGEELINRVLKDVAYYPAALPLLSSTMHIFYEHAKTNDREQKLIYKDYEALGGVEGALSANAEAFFKSLKNDRGEADIVAQELMQKIILRMVQPVDAAYSRRRVSYAEASSFSVPDSGAQTRTKNLYFELNFALENPLLLKQLIDRMESAHLLVQGKNHEGIPTVEPAHDALINYWPRCLEWIQNLGRDNLSLQRDLWKAALGNLHFSEEEGERDESKQNKRRGGNGFLANFNDLWDTNPKLGQVLALVSKAAASFVQQTDETTLIEEFFPDMPLADQSIFKPQWKQWREDGETPDLSSLILSGYSTRLLKLMLEKGDHWLNKVEKDFILQSWEKRTQDILDLKKERDMALARALAGKARQVYNYDHTLALRLAYTAYQDAGAIPASSKELEPVFEDICSAIHDISSGVDSHFYQIIIELDGLPHCIACSPNGKHLAVGQNNRKISVWDLQTGEKIRDITTGITREVMAVAFSPITADDPKGGKYLISGGRDRRVKIWEFEKPEQAPLNIPRKTPFNNDVWSLAFSPDGKFIAIGTKNGSGTLLYELDSEVYRRVGRRSNTVDISPDGKYLAYGNDDNAAFIWEMKWEAIDEEQALKIAPGGGDVQSISFSPDSQLLMTTSGWGAKLWKVSDGQELVDKRMEGHSNGVRAVAFSPDGKYTITGSDDYTVRMYDISGEGVKEVKCFKGHNGWVRALTFTPDGKHIVTASHDKTVKIQAFSTTREKAAFLSDKYQITGVDFYPSTEEPVAIFSAGLSACIWKPDAPVSEQIVVIEKRRETSMAKFTPNGKYFITGGNTKDKELRIWEYEHGQAPQFRQRCKHDNRVTSAAFSKDSKYLVTSGTDRNTRLWRLENFKAEGNPDPLRSFKKGKLIYAVAFMDDNQHFLTADQDGIVRVWHINNAENEKNSFSADDSRPWGGGTVRSLAFFSKVEDKTERQYILTGHLDRTVRLWKADHFAEEEQKPTLIRSFTGHSAVVNVAIFSKDGQYILSGSEDRTAKLWDVQSGALLQSINGHSAGIVDVAFSKDDRYLLTGSADKSAKWWNNPMWQLENGEIPPLTKRQKWRFSIAEDA